MLGESIIVNILNRLTGKPRPPATDGLLLGYAREGREQRVAVSMPHQSRMEHAVILGKTGMGKTHLLQVVAEQHMRRREGFILFDYHGDCVDTLLRVATLFPWASECLVLIDPTDRTSSPGLNPLQLRGDEQHDAFGRVSELTAILRARWHVDAFGPRSEELLRNVLYTLAVNGLTLLEAPTLLTSTAFRSRCTASLPSPDVEAYWRDRFEPLSEAMKAVFREPLMNKITAFLVDPATRHLLGQTESTIDFGAAMQGGSWVLVNLSKGVLRENSQTLGNLIFAKLQFDVFNRIHLTPQDRRLFSILVDEVQNLAENDLITLLTEGRKFGVALVTANQYWEQLPRVLRGALLAAGTQMFFRVSHADASVLAAELSVTGRQRYLAELTQLPRGDALVRIGQSPPQHVHVPALPSLSRQAAHAAAQLRALTVNRYARARDVIEHDIRRRADTLTHTNRPHNTPDHVHPNEGQLDW